MPRDHRVARARMSTTAPSRRMTPVSAGRTPNSASATSVRPEPTRSGEPEHLATPDLEGDLFERSFPAERLDAEGDIAGLVGHTAEEVGQLAPDHVADQRHLGDVADWLGRDVVAVAEHGDPVAELEHLVEAVADEEDRHARCRQLAHLAEEPVDLVRRKGGGRFVHDQDADLAGHRLGDLDRLLPGHGQLRRHRAGVDVDVELAEDRPGPGVHVPPAHEPAAVDLTHEDVLRHRQVREHQRVLVDAGDPERLGICRAAQLDGLAVHGEMAAIRPVEAGHQLDQRGLACAVLADERVDLTGGEVKRHPAQGMGGPEALRDVDHGQQRPPSRWRVSGTFPRSRASPSD